MRDDLVGFLVGALDASEHDELKRKLDTDQQLQQQLRLVDRGLQPLRWDAGQLDPPRGLAARTCDLIGRYAEEAKVERGRGRSLSPASRRESSSQGRQWTVADFVVAAGVCLAAACLFFPAIINSRYHHQMNACQMKMRDIGLALTDYSMQDRRGMFPTIPAQGKLAVAGMYAPTLVDKGLVEDPQVFYCPAKNNTIVLKIPHVSEILSAEGSDLVSLHNSMGGDFAYTLGFFKDGHLQGIRNRGRKSYPVLADEPREQLANSVITSHGRGQNLYFEDGRVAFVTTRIRPNTKSDDLFLNDDGAVYAGLHADDAVLAPSSARPLPVGWKSPAAR